MDKIRVLYIENDQAQRREFARLLRAKSFTVVPAVSGESGLKLLHTRKVDAILCDLHMPGMNGLEVLKRARKILPSIPVIILTGHGSTALAVRAIKRGAYHFVLKPLDIEDIAITIHQAIEHAQLEHQLKESEAQLKRYSEELEGTVAERTARLEYANRQLAALTDVSNRFTAIFDQDELFDTVPSLLTKSLDFDRAALILGDEKQLTLRSLCFEKDSREFIERFVRKTRAKGVTLPPHFHESMKKNKTIHIPDLNADPRWPKDNSRLIRTKAIVISPVRVKGKPIGVIMGNMQHHERVMDKQDIARLEMFANMVGLAVDNIRARRENRIASFGQSHLKRKSAAVGIQHAGVGQGKCRTAGDQRKVGRQKRGAGKTPVRVIAWPRRVAGDPGYRRRGHYVGGQGRQCPRVQSPCVGIFRS